MILEGNMFATGRQDRRYVSLWILHRLCQNKWAFFQICPPLSDAFQHFMLVIWFNEQRQNGYRRSKGYAVLSNATFMKNIDDEKRDVCVCSC